MLAILPYVAMAGFIATLAVVALRYHWSGQGTGKPPGAGLWILTALALWLWWSAMSNSLTAQAKRGTYQALAALQVVTADDLQRRPELEGAPVVVSDQAFCAEKIATNVDAVAIRTSYSGEEEKGDDYEYIDQVDYGSDAEVARFTLGSANSPVRVDNDLLTVLPAGDAQTKTVPTNEYSTVAGGRYLNEFQSQQVIPCGAHVSVTGLVTKQGQYTLLAPMAKSVSIITDRPWPQILDHARARVDAQDKRALFWFVPALVMGLVQLAVGLVGRRA